MRSITYLSVSYKKLSATNEQEATADYESLLPACKFHHPRVEIFYAVPSTSDQVRSCQVEKTLHASTWREMLCRSCISRR